MKKIPARRIMDFTPSDFTKKLKSNIILIYDDGIEVEHTAHELAINRYVYSVLELAPDIGIKSTYSIHNYYVGGQYVANTINKAFEAILSDIVDMYVETSGSRKCLEKVYEKMYEIFETIYNEVIYEHLEYVASLNIKHFLQIQLKPELMAAIDDVRKKRDLDSVKQTYEILDKVIRTSPDLKENPIAKGYISGTISANQVKQLLASRGFVTEIDSSIFKYPIASSFVLGMDDMYDMAVESRSGAKALYLSNRAIGLSEYLAREIQLTTMMVEVLEDGDCGNKDYLEWSVTEKDFNNLLGKRYFQDGKELVIDGNSRDIIGTTVKLRSAGRCKLENKNHICTACFGRLSNNVPMHANIGHITTTVLTAIISQLILSTKHVTTSASSDSIALTGDMRDFFIVKNKDTYAFRANTINKKKQKFRLHIPQEQGFGIADVPKSNDPYRLNLARVSSLSLIYLSIEESDGSIRELPLHVKQGNRLGNLTYDFLAHIKKYGYSLDDDDRYCIELDNWPTGVSIISLPQVEFSYLDLANTIKGELKYMKDDIGTPEAFLHHLFNLVNHKLNINIALLEVIVYAFTAADPDNGNFDFGRNSAEAKPSKMCNIISNRSVGGSYAWENVRKTMLTPTNYYGMNNINHPLDIMLKPNETLLEHYGML